MLKSLVNKFLWLAIYLALVSAFIKTVLSLDDYSLFEELGIVSLLSLVTIILVIVIENKFPYDKSNNKFDMQYINNIAYFGISNYAEIIGKASALFVVPFVVNYVNISNVNLWPTKINTIFQVILGILIYDFVYYWYHRASHTYSLLWRLHRLHHSTERLNILALGRFNFLDIIIELFILTSVITILGIPLKIFYLMQSFMLPATLLSHANFNAYMPNFLNWIVINPTTHRIHHAKSPELHDKNFGGFSLFWDVVFGTYEPGYSLGKYETGLSDHKTSKWIWYQMFDFLKK